MKILIIEVDKIQNDVLASFLEKEGYETFSAYTLGEAYVILDKQAIKLILLDSTLPNGNGFNFLKNLKLTAHVPVIVRAPFKNGVTPK